jgi:1-deoxy-D-xylulose-5-phosphate reductoisomerase
VIQSHATVRRARPAGPGEVRPIATAPPPGVPQEPTGALRPAAVRAVALVGATGSIGQNTLEVVARYPGRLRLAALAARRNWEAVCTAAVAFGAEAVALADPQAAAAARRRLEGTGIRVLDGEAGVEEVARWPGADITLVAASGIAGLRPVLAALGAGRDVALANKESLVAAGRLVTATAARQGARLLPVDSEHSAIFQCLRGRDAAGVARLWLTASGGPFRDWPGWRIATASPEQAQRHPTWRMGQRITVDSATLMNKGFEVLEACWLFGLDPAAVRVVVHPQSLVHAFVQFVDGALLAQCAPPDMRLPIAYALSYPERWAASGVPALDLYSLGRLEFEPPDPERFPCLRLAYAAAEAGGLAGAVLNAADEVAVERFLRREIAFGDIPRLVEFVLSRPVTGDDGRLEDVLAADAQARHLAWQWKPATQVAVQLPGPPQPGSDRGGAARADGTGRRPRGRPSP